MTGTQQKFYGLDHLRALAIFYVFLFHYFILSGGQPSWLPAVAGFGWTGVDLFFVLSGFLIASQLFEQIKAGETISFRHFFLKRFFRIIPAFWLTVALYFCLPVFREKEQLAPLWKFLTFTQNFGLDLHSYGTFSHGWSLCVEEHFYLFLPLILMALQRTRHFRRSYWLLIVLFLLGFAIRLYSYTNLYLPKNDDELGAMYWYKYIYYPTYNRLDGLLAGVSIAGLYCFFPMAWAKISKYGNLLLLGGLGILIGAYFLCEDQKTFNASIFGFPIVSLGYAFIVTGAVSPESILYKWRSTVTSTVAGLSYALYLTHKGVIHVTHLLLHDHKIDSNALLVICMVVCVGFAYVVNRVVERPFMEMRKRIIRKEVEDSERPHPRPLSEGEGS